MPSFSEMSSSALFWASFWPCMAFAVMALAFLIPPLWFWYGRR